jgi:hypothetical protein
MFTPFWFWNIFHSAKYSVSYVWDAWRNTRRTCLHHCLILVKIGMCWLTLLEFPNIKYLENLFSVLKLLCDDRQTQWSQQAILATFLCKCVNRGQPWSNITKWSCNRIQCFLLYRQNIPCMCWKIIPHENNEKKFFFHWMGCTTK